MNSEVGLRPIGVPACPTMGLPWFFDGSRHRREYIFTLQHGLQTRYAWKPDDRVFCVRSLRHSYAQSGCYAKTLPHMARDRSYQGSSAGASDCWAACGLVMYERVVNVQPGRCWCWRCPPTSIKLLIKPDRVDQHDGRAAGFLASSGREPGPGEQGKVCRPALARIREVGMEQRYFLLDQFTHNGTIAVSAPHVHSPTSTSRL